MSSIRRIAHSIFVWSYERGTIQYDIICALILAFIFFVPPSCFVSKRAAGPQATHQQAPNSRQSSGADLRR
jgi:hypothetical protein